MNQFKSMRMRDGDDMKGYIFLVPKINENECDFDQYCSVFGCGEKLSLTEKLCGNGCINHMGHNSIIFFNGKL